MENMLINKLMEVLEGEMKIYNELLELSNRKKDIIINGKIKELENTVKIEQSLVLQTGRLEDAREELVEQISSQVGLESKELTISKLSEYFGNECSEKLKNIQVNLVKILEQLKSSNELNSKLIKNSLEYINFSVNLISNINSQGNNYHVDGQVGEGQKRNFFDIKL